MRDAGRTLWRPTRWQSRRHDIDRARRRARGLRRRNRIEPVATAQPMDGMRARGMRGWTASPSFVSAGATAHYCDPPAGRSVRRPQATCSVDSRAEDQDRRLQTSVHGLHPLPTSIISRPARRAVEQGRPKAQDPTPPRRHGRPEERTGRKGPAGRRDRANTETAPTWSGHRP